MFKIVPNPTFASDVSLTVPGQAEFATLRLTWRHQGRKALRQWLDKPRAAVEADGPPPDDADFMGAVIAGWAGPVDEAGAAVAYSQPALAALLDAYPAAGGELFTAYLGALTESRAKN